MRSARGVFGAGGQGASTGVEGETVGQDRRDREHREETRIRQPLFVSHHRPGVGACDDQDVGASTVRRADHPNGHEYVARQADRGGDSIHQGRQLLHRGRRPGGPGPDRRCLVAACGCRATGPGLPTLDLHRVSVLRARSRRATPQRIRLRVCRLSARVQPQPDLRRRREDATGLRRGGGSDPLPAGRAHDPHHLRHRAASPPHPPQLIDDRGRDRDTYV